MTVKSITTIHSILEKEAKESLEIYKEMRKSLEEKYGTEWLDKEISESEKEDLDEARKKSVDLVVALNDFEKHQW